MDSEKRYVLHYNSTDSINGVTIKKGELMVGVVANQEDEDGLCFGVGYSNDPYTGL